MIKSRDIVFLIITGVLILLACPAAYAATIDNDFREKLAESFVQLEGPELKPMRLVYADIVLKTLTDNGVELSEEIRSDLLAGIPTISELSHREFIHPLEKELHQEKLKYCINNYLNAEQPDPQEQEALKKQIGELLGQLEETLIQKYDKLSDEIKKSVEYHRNTLNTFIYNKLRRDYKKSLSTEDFADIKKSISEMQLELINSECKHAEESSKVMYKVRVAIEGALFPARSKTILQELPESVSYKIAYQTFRQNRDDIQIWREQQHDRKLELGYLKIKTDNILLDAGVTDETLLDAAAEIPSGPVDENLWGTYGTPLDTNDKIDVEQSGNPTANTTNNNLKEIKQKADKTKLEDPPDKVRVVKDKKLYLVFGFIALLLLACLLLFKRNLKQSKSG